MIDVFLTSQLLALLATSDREYFLAEHVWLGHKLIRKGTRLEEEVVCNMVHSGIKEVALLLIEDDELLENDFISELAPLLFVVGGSDSFEIVIGYGKAVIKAKFDGCLSYDFGNLVSFNDNLDGVLLALKSNYCRVTKGQEIASLKSIDLYFSRRTLSLYKDKLVCRPLSLSLLPFAFRIGCFRVAFVMSLFVHSTEGSVVSGTDNRRAAGLIDYDTWQEEQQSLASDSTEERSSGAKRGEDFYPKLKVIRKSVDRFRSKFTDYGLEPDIFITHHERSSIEGSILWLFDNYELVFWLPPQSLTSKQDLIVRSTKDFMLEILQYGTAQDTGNLMLTLKLQMPQSQQQAGISKAKKIGYLVLNSGCIRSLGYNALDRCLPIFLSNPELIRKANPELGYGGYYL